MKEASLGFGAVWTKVFTTAPSDLVVAGGEQESVVESGQRGIVVRLQGSSEGRIWVTTTVKRALEGIVVRSRVSDANAAQDERAESSGVEVSCSVEYAFSCKPHLSAG